MLSGRMRSNGAVLTAVLLLALMAILSFGAALHESPAFDEIAHIGAGLSYVQKFDLRLNPEHPPLPKALSGLSLTLRGTRADYSGPAWTYSRDFVSAFLGEWSFGQWVISRWNDPATTLAWARFPMLLLTLALGWAIFVYASRLGGFWGGAICLAVYVSTPVFLTFGPLVLTDIPIALFSVLSIWAFASLWRSPSRTNIWIFTLTQSGAFLSKFTAAIVLFGLLISGLTTRWMPLPEAEGKLWRRQRWRAIAKGLAWTALLTYLFLLVFSWNQPTDSLAPIGSSFPALLLRRLLFPPLIYLRGMSFVLFTFNRPSFLLGRAYPHGVWFFYPVVVALKSQSGFLVLLLLALVLAVVPGKTRATRVIPPELRMHWRTLWVSLVVFASVCVLSRFDISVRHFSVPLTLLILLLAPLPRMLEQLKETHRAFFYAATAVTVALVLGCLFTAVHVYPWYFPYINALGMGKPAYTLMSDSNVDWDQALPEAKRFAERNKIQDLAFDGYGASDDTLFIPRSHSWDCQAPSLSDANQWVVVSANMILDGHNCSWLLQYPSEQLAGGGMYAFHLPAAIPPAGAPGGPPKPSDRRVFLGAPFDFKALSIQVSRQPETIPVVLKQMMQSFAAASQRAPQKH